MEIGWQLDLFFNFFTSQGLHRKFPDVAKCYIPFFQKMYQQFDIPFPVSKGMSEIPTDMSAVLVPSSPAKVQQDGLVAPEALTVSLQIILESSMLFTRLRNYTRVDKLRVLETLNFFFVEW